MTSGQNFGPMSFIEYCKGAGVSGVRTADCISVQELRNLAPELKAADVMVFRLGTAKPKRGTSFALAKHFAGWGDYFFLDEEIFPKSGESALDVSENERLEIYRLLPKSTETSLVNFAASSGVLGAALGIDDPADVIFCATAQGTYTFNVLPHTKLMTTWSHSDGQVEIDGAFIARRKEEKTLFVIEAKVSDRWGSLAKAKLAYPMLAMLTKVEDAMPVIGVYLRVLRKADGFEFDVAQCEFQSSKREISSLAVIQSCRIRVKL